MSPTATIASILVALIFFAWLFQSDTKDPNYQAYLKRQEEARKADPAQKAAMGISVTDSGVTKDDSPLEFNRNDSKDPGNAAITSGEVFLPDTSGGQNQPTSTGEGGKPTTRKTIENTHAGFGASAKLNGTYTRVDYVGDSPAAQTTPDVPSITFRREGTFTTQNMAAADVDMENGSTVVASLDRGSGTYKLHGNTLELKYTDGLTRHKGPLRNYVVAPVGWADNAPTAITIQGKIFKLDTSH
jgi:hypothetical protein